MPDIDQVLPANTRERKGLGAGYDAVNWQGVGIAGDVGWFCPGDSPNNGIGLGSEAA